MSETKSISVSTLTSSEVAATSIKIRTVPTECFNPPSTQAVSHSVGAASDEISSFFQSFLLTIHLVEIHFLIPMPSVDVFLCLIVHFPLCTFLCKCHQIPSRIFSQQNILRVCDDTQAGSILIFYYPYSHVFSNIYLYFLILSVCKYVVRFCLKLFKIYKSFSGKNNDKT